MRNSCLLVCMPVLWTFDGYRCVLAAWKEGHGIGLPGAGTHGGVSAAIVPRTILGVKGTKVRVGDVLQRDVVRKVCSIVKREVSRRQLYGVLHWTELDGFSADVSDTQRKLQQGAQSHVEGLPSWCGRCPFPRSLQGLLPQHSAIQQGSVPLWRLRRTESVLCGSTTASASSFCPRTRCTSVFTTTSASPTASASPQTTLVPQPLPAPHSARVLPLPPPQPLHQKPRYHPRCVTSDPASFSTPTSSPHNPWLYQHPQLLIRLRPLASALASVSTAACGSTTSSASGWSSNRFLCLEDHLPLP